MANPLRGEVDLHAGDQTYTMRMSINAIVNLENHFDKGINEIAELLSEPKGMRIGNLRTIVLHTLKEHHPGLTEEGAGDVIGKAGFEATAEAIQRAMILAFPSAKAEPERPQKPKRAGTGKAS